MFSLARNYLQPVKKLRFEWSIQLTKQSCNPREKTLFWVDKEELTNNNSSYTPLYNLLKSLDCPEEILAQQIQLQDSAKTQGIRIDLNLDSPSHCLYIDVAEIIPDKTIKAFHWRNKNVQKITEYSFHKFNKIQSYKEPLYWIHNELKDSFEKLCLNSELLMQSGYGYQHQNGRIQEVYLTFFWHPRINSIINHLPKPMQKLLIDASYENLAFRHIGFSNVQDSEPSLTIYFSAPYRKYWPKTFSEFQWEVTCSSNLLVEEIAVYGGL